MKRKKNTEGLAFLISGGTLSGVLTLLILLGLFWTPYDPGHMDGAAKFSPPSAAHLLGTDNFGRDIFSRVLQGAGSSFLIALCVVVFSCALGVLIGGLCGYYGGLADLILTRLCDSITAFPAILLALVIVSLTGSGAYNVVLALGLLFIPSFARLARGEFARCRELNYVKSAKLMGAGDGRILFCHILPNTLPVLLPAVSIGFNNAILSEASMSFLGVGVSPTESSLGSMLSDSQTYLQSAPWYALCTGGAVVLLVLGFSLLGEGLQRRWQR